ncbi:MAG: hypothetical protein KA821_10240 [Chitinophagaceae bacterium]|nr:hypothetical protein [Chitinophagaceae bacterium]
MILFKKIDILGQLILILAGLISVSVSRDLDFLIFYVLVGAWQLLSCAIHALYRHSWYLLKQRRSYYWWLLLSVILLATLFMGSIFSGLAMLVLGVVLAFWYMSICIREFKLLLFKNAVHLKR